MEASKSRSAHARLFGTSDLTRQPRCSVIVAHSDDEIVGAGCLISKLANITVLHITDGTPPSKQDAQAAGFERLSDYARADYARARRQECISALALANVPQEKIVDFGVADQQAPHYLAALAKRITTFLQQSAPDFVLTHPYEGGHPDHDAAAFATHAATRLIRQSGIKPPVVFEIALHPSRDGKSKVPEFLPNSTREITTLVLDQEARDLKCRMYDCFATQRQVLKASPIGPEKFRQPPCYDFRRPPQRGKLHYENFACGLTGEQWQILACKALENLFPAVAGHSAESDSFGVCLDQMRRCEIVDEPGR